MGHPPRRGEIQQHRLFPFLLAAEPGHGPGTAGVIDQDVERTERLVDTRFHAIRGAVGGNVLDQYQRSFPLSGGNTVVNVSLVEDSSKAGQIDQKQNGSGVDLVAYVTQIAKRAVAGDLASGQGDISKALGARYGLTPRFR